MNIAAYPARLSPYPTDRFIAMRRVDPKDYRTTDGFCLKLGPLGVSIAWKRARR